LSNPAILEHCSRLPLLPVVVSMPHSNSILNILHVARHNSPRDIFHGVAIQ
jgi:hypothetical protein